MACKRCKSDRILSVLGKCNDSFCAEYHSNGAKYQGYVPYDIGLRGGDFIDFSYCLDCGQIQGDDFPLPEPEKL